MSIVRFTLFLGVLVLGGAFKLQAQAEKGMEAIQAAAQENKHLFVFFYKDQQERTLRAQKIFDQGMQKLVDRAFFIKINVTDPSEKGIVEKFNLKRTPMPFVLALAPNGAVTGGFPASALTEKQLLNAVASSGMASCLKALQSRKLVFLCLQNKQTPYQAAALKGVQEFQTDSRFAGATEIVVIDPEDKQEHGFLSQFDLKMPPDQATTVFISPPAEVIAKYKGATHKEQLIADLKNAVSGCCGPGGCCPGGCCSGGCCGPQK